MNRLKRIRRTLGLLLVIVWSACASAPPTLSLHATQAFNNTRVIKALDIVRDTAISANAQVPPLVGTATTKRIVTYHESALKIIDAAPAGWSTAVQTGLDELVKDLPPPEKQLLAPYVNLVKTVIAEVTK
jgi:hypothetical protein